MHRCSAPREGTTRVAMGAISWWGEWIQRTSQSLLSSRFKGMGSSSTRDPRPPPTYTPSNRRVAASLLESSVSGSPLELAAPTKATRTLPPRPTPSRLRAKPRRRRGVYNNDSDVSDDRSSPRLSASAGKPSPPRELSQPKTAACGASPSSADVPRGVRAPSPRSIRPADARGCGRLPGSLPRGVPSPRPRRSAGSSSCRRSP